MQQASSMQSFIVAAKDKKIALDLVESECKKNQIAKLDINLLTFEKAIGITDVRNLQKQLMLRPIKSECKAVIIDIYNGITIESQNSLLKTLEEPPKHTFIYIIVPNKELLLPTILSRCKIIQFKDKIEITKEENASYLNILISLPKMQTGEKLKLAQDVAKNKEEAKLWIEKMIIIVRQKLLEAYNKKLSTINYQLSTLQYLNMLISLNKTYKIISTTNTNQRLALENLFINL